jgi:glycosyltransferase involved in cell wall biosynthesis
MSNITFILFTYNEEKRLPFILKNFSAYGPIYILDGGSTDRTKEVAEAGGATFFVRPASTKPNVETPEMYGYVKSLVKTDWIYWGYADNIAPKPLMDKLEEISKQQKIKSVMIPLYTYLWGNTKHYTLKSHAPFFFHKDHTDFSSNLMHGIGKFTGTKDEMLTLPNTEDFALKHFSTYNETKFVHGHMRYSEAEAREKFETGRKFGLLRLFYAMLAYAWIFGKYNWKNGKLGVLIVLNYMFYRVMSYTRLYEMENGITLESIEETYSKKKEEILKDFK